MGGDEEILQNCIPIIEQCSLFDSRLSNMYFGDESSSFSLMKTSNVFNNCTLCKRIH